MARKRNKKAPIIIGVLVVLILVIGGAFGYSYVNSDINGSSEKGTDYTLVIKDNDFEYEIATKLMNGSVIKSDAVWSWWMDNHYPKFTFYNGEYKMNSSMSYQQIVEKLKNPDISHKKVKVCIPEGYNVFEIADTLQKNGICKKADFLKACSTTDGYSFDWLADFPKDNTDVGYILEGFLFPATYDFGENSDAKNIVNTMLQTFDSKITKDITDFCSKNNMNLYQFVSLCSVVQEEALTKSSQKNIASTLINRLNKGMKLECDVTYYYAKKLKDNGFSDDVYNAYYTYRCQGLPAGPITNPGAEIMASTVQHPNTDYIYFFSDLNKEFHFASTYEEFEKLKLQYPWQ